MSELSDLYHDLILDHGTKPRNARVSTDANRKAEGYNPLCGDRICVYATVEGDRIADLSFTGVGCAICQASASLMSEAVQAKTTADAETLFQAFKAMLRGERDASELPEKLRALGGVRQYPMRVKCATLPWHTMKAALDDRDVVISTE